MPNATDVLSNSYNYSLSTGIVDSVLKVTNNRDYIANISFSGIEAQTNFILFAVLSSPLGYSNVYSIKFKTLQLSFGTIV